jgi:hypothetical protein
MVLCSIAYINNPISNSINTAPKAMAYRFRFRSSITISSIGVDKTNTRINKVMNARKNNVTV